MLGIYQRDDALRLAEERGLDVLEIAPQASPPTCKLMDYGKWKYEAKKKAHTARKKQTVIIVKEVQMRPRTDQHDVNVKLRHARRFLIEGDKVKISIRFSGREMAHQELGLELLKKVSAWLEPLSTVESQPRLEGRSMFLMLAPDPIKIKEWKKTQPAEDATEDVIQDPAQDAPQGVDTTDDSIVPDNKEHINTEPAAVE